METNGNNPEVDEARMAYLYAALEQYIEGNDYPDPFTSFLEGLMVSRTEAFALGCMYMSISFELPKKLFGGNK